MKLSDIHLRDPFVLPVPAEKAYYLYGSTGFGAPFIREWGFDCYRSTDLVSWEGPFPAFRGNPNFWGTKEFWAPEVYARENKFYLLGTFNSDAGHFRRSQLLVADKPAGPFQPYGEPLTPKHWMCLDATLWEEIDGSLWTVFCHEWLQVHDGGMWATPLNPQLGAAGRPLYLFNASEAPWVRPLQDSNRPYPCYVTDGPFLYRNSAGSLLMLWSSFGDHGYAMGISHSESGSITGPWSHEPEPLVAQDGGHGMIFRSFEGRLYLTYHQPNTKPLERPVLVPIREQDNSLSIEKD
jgi:arabinan endo-1,5-alpha-L-arabinosidase